MGFWKRAVAVKEHPSGPRESVRHYTDEAFQDPPVTRWPIAPAPVAIDECGNTKLFEKLDHELHADEREAKEACGRTDRLHGISAGGPMEPWIKQTFPTQEAHASFKVTKRKPLYTHTTSDLIHKPKYKLTRPNTSGGYVPFEKCMSREQRQQQGHGVPIKLVNQMYDWTHYGDEQHRPTGNLNQPGRHEDVISHFDPRQTWFGQREHTVGIDEPRGVDLSYDMDKIQACAKKHRTPNTHIDTGQKDRFKTGREPKEPEPAFYGFLSGKGMPSTGPAIGECCLKGSAVYGKKTVSTFAHMRGRDGSLVTNVEQYLRQQSAANRAFLVAAKRRTDKARYALMSTSAFTRAQEVEKAKETNFKKGPKSKGGTASEIRDPQELKRLAAKAADPRVPPPECITVEAPPPQLPKDDKMLDVDVVDVGVL